MVKSEHPHNKKAMMQSNKINALQARDFMKKRRYLSFNSKPKRCSLTGGEGSHRFNATHDLKSMKHSINSIKSAESQSEDEPV